MYGKALRISIAVICALCAPSIVYAGGKQEIRAVSFDDKAGATRVVIRSSETPTFTAYKLERPTRVVLDIPTAKLAENLIGHENNLAIIPAFEDEVHCLGSFRPSRYQPRRCR